MLGITIPRKIQYIVIDNLAAKTDLQHNDNDNDYQEKALDCIITQFHKNILELSHGSAILDTSNIQKKSETKSKKVDGKDVYYREGVCTGLGIKQFDAKGNFKTIPLNSSITTIIKYGGTGCLVMALECSDDLVTLFEGRMPQSTFEKTYSGITATTAENVATNLQILTHRLKDNHEVLNPSTQALLQVIFPKMTPLQEKSTLINFIKELQKTYNNSAELNEKQNEIIDFLYQYTQTEVHDVNQKLFNQIIPLSITNHIFFQEDAQCSNLRILLGLPKFAPKILSRSASTITTTKDDVRTIINDALDRDQNSTLLHEKELTQHLITFSLSKQTLDDEKTFFINIESTLSKDRWYLKGSVWSHLNKSSHEVLAHVNNSASFLFSWKSLKLNFFGFFNFLYEIIFSYNKNKTLFRPEPMPNIPEAALLKPADITVDDVSNEVKQRFELDTDEKIKNYVAAYNVEQAAIYAEHMALHSENLANDAEQAYYEANLFSKYFSFDGASQHAEKLRNTADTAAEQAKQVRQLSNQLTYDADLTLPSKSKRKAQGLNSVDKVLNSGRKQRLEISKTIDTIALELNETGSQLPQFQDLSAGDPASFKNLNTAIDEGNKTTVLQYLEDPRHQSDDEENNKNLSRFAQAFKESSLFQEHPHVKSNRVHATVTLLQAKRPMNVDFPPENRIKSYNTDAPKITQKFSLFNQNLSNLKDGIQKAREEVNVIKNSIDSFVLQGGSISDLQIQKNDTLSRLSETLFSQAQAADINITKSQLTLLINCHTATTVEDYIEKNKAGTHTHRPILRKGNSVQPALPLASVDNPTISSSLLLQN